MVGELYGQYVPINSLTAEDKKFLASHSIVIERSEIHDAAGINDDYPAGRGVFKEDHNRFVILVNFEDHIEIIMLPQKGSEFLRSLQ